MAKAGAGKSSKSKGPRIPKLGKFARPGRKLLGRVFLNRAAHYCGEWGTAECDENYRRLIGEWLARDCKPAPPEPEQVSVARVCADYLAYAVLYYRKNGRETSEVGAIRAALRPLLESYARTAAAEFGPRELDAYRIARAAPECKEAAHKDKSRKGAARTTVNQDVLRIRRMFKWAAARELVPAGVPVALSSLAGWRAGRCIAREAPPRKAPPEWAINAVLPALPRVVREMVRLQVYSGMRSGELCQLRPCDVDRSGDVWVYTPREHKTSHHGKARVIVLGPKAQEILTPFLDNRPAGSPCFSPAESERERRAELHANRKTPLSCGNSPEGHPGRAGGSYTPATYAKCVARAIKQVNKSLAEKELELIPAWSPHCLRHAFAGMARSAFGLEAARTALGHSKADMSEHYAKRDLQTAMKVAREIG